MGNTVKKRNFAEAIKIAFYSIIYVTKALPSSEEDQNSKIDEQVEKIRKQEDSSYIAELEANTNSSKNAKKRKIHIRNVENANKIQSAKIKNINENYNKKEREERI